MTKEGWCSNLGEGFDVSKGRDEMALVYDETRSRYTVGDVLIAASIR